MKQKGTAAQKQSAGTEQILCPKCGHEEFKRSVSETDSIVRLAFTKNSEAVQEIMIHEGNIEFAYRCANCGTPLVERAKTG
jgi:DNA-directed RNA polymerase subunit RPC12/RpoP